MRRPTDVFLLYAARAARGFGDGFAIIILPAYLSELGFGAFKSELSQAQPFLERPPSHSQSDFLLLAGTCAIF